MNSTVFTGFHTVESLLSIWITAMNQKWPTGHVNEGQKVCLIQVHGYISITVAH